MINNLAKKVLDYGGSVQHLSIPFDRVDGGVCNPSIYVGKNNEVKVNLRHVQYSFWHNEFDQKFPSLWGPLSYTHPEDDLTLLTTNYLCDLDPITLKIENFNKINTSKLDTKPLWAFVGLEDARLVRWDDKFYYCGVRRDTTTNGVGRIELSEIYNSEEISRKRISVTDKNSYCEKNWMPIIDQPYHFVKWTNPTEVVKVDINNNTSETTHLVENNIDFKRDIRGGSQVIPYGDYHIAIIHEVNLYNNEIGQKDADYYHRFIVWDKDWNISYYSDEFNLMDTKVEFSCGLALHNDELLITFGFQDSSSFIMRLPSQLFEELVGIKEQSVKLQKKKSPYTPRLLRMYIEDTNNPLHNFNLGEYFFKNEEYAGALSFFLKAAELGNSLNIQRDIVYESLIKVAICVGTQGGRPVNERIAYLNAITFEPTRPEAYLKLSHYYEYYQKWHDCYSTSVLGDLYKDNSKETLTDMGYPGNWIFKFQKAISGYWLGFSKESRNLLFDLLTYDIDDMSENYKNLLEQNITSLGSGADSFLRYEKSLYQKLKYKFDGSDNIKRNYSQTYQDMFILTMLNGKRKGTYLEIGSANPFDGNNTVLLEKSFDWVGVSLEIDRKFIDDFNQNRLNPVIHTDALTVDYVKLLKKHNLSNDIDYLQLDCDPPKTTYDILKKIPFDTHKFAVITFEHDYYADMTKSYREKSRKFLISKGYVLIGSNISSNEISPYEDWWVHPDLVDSKIMKIMKNDDDIKKADDFMLL